MISVLTFNSKVVSGSNPAIASLARFGPTFILGHDNDGAIIDVPKFQRESFQVQDFRLNQMPQLGTEQIFINGLLTERDLAYVIVGRSVTLNQYDPGDRVVVIYYF